ncbi:MAG: hypothetical protein HZB19_05180 [Chloroflexi bacterium]|nr:hypothetical protein [Chloroflexota bacterium]
MYHLRRLPIFTLILILLMAFSPLGPSIQNENDPDLGDAETYAKLNGVSVEEALRRFHIQDIAGDLDAELSVKEAETFAGLWIEHTPKFKVVVLFTQDGEKSIGSYLTEELVAIVDVQPAKISLVELQYAQKETLSSLWNMEIPVESEINVYENNIKIFVTQADRMRLDDALQDKLLTIPDYIKIITVPELGKTEVNIHGGLGLNPCTSAFSVENSQGVRGVTTAAHCSQSYSLSYNGIYLPLQSWIKSTSYDVSWYTTPGLTITNQIQVATTGTLRRINATKSRDSQAIGGYVCK